MRNGLIRLSRAALCVAACFGGVASTAAAPTLPKVVAGQATFSQDGNVFSITNTPGTIINWQSFSVNAGEITRFIQQNSDSAVLNRVNGQDPSRILGALQSNGKVYLINPNGVVFGQGARVDVNGLVASTLDMSDADFLAGKKNFIAGPKAGNIRNEGAITTPSGGKVFLVAPNVENSGIISAPNGEVVLAAGRSVQLVDSGNPDLTVVVSAPGDQAINLGQVVANGGRIGIYGALLNQRGVVNANSAVVGQDGRIVLKASRETVLEQGSVTSAVGAGKGGEIQLLGERVSLAGNAQVDASGAARGGTVLVGGDYQGKNAALPNAQQASFGKDAVIRADASVNGDGGKVVLWSDGATNANGSISARGAGAGKGGLVETSGRRLDLDGVRVDAGGGKAGGRKGTWLIDPTNIVVADSGTEADTTYIPAERLTATNADIVLQATNNLKILQNITTAHNVRGEAGNELTVGAAVTSTGGSIDLRARNHINLLEGSLLASPNYIDLTSNRMTLAGMIDGVGATLPVVSFNAFSSGTSIFVNADQVTNALTLAPGRLAAFKTYEINIGNSGHTGDVVINAPLTLAGNLVIDTAGRIDVNTAVLLTGATSQFLATLHAPGRAFQVASTGSINAGRRIGIAGAGPVAIDGKLGSGEVAIAAGSAGMTLTADIAANGRTTLRTEGAIQQGGAIVKSAELLVEASNVNMLGKNQVGTLAGVITGTGTAPGLRFGWTGDLRIGSVGGRDGVFSPNEVSLTGGKLIVDSLVDARVILADAGAILGDGTLKASILSLESRGGIGEASRPLKTSADIIMRAVNTATGSAPINIVNDRVLTLGDVVQAGTGNAGAISVETTGGLTVAATTEGHQGVKTGSGDIRLVTHSPLTILGKVGTDSGNVTLLADNKGALTIGAGGQVASGSGSVKLTGGTVSYPAGSVVVDPAKLAVTRTDQPVQQPDPVRPDPVPPALNVCLADPATAGCGGVIEQATRSCMSNPDAPGCAEVLPPVDSCRAEPGRLGCAVVIQREEIRLCIVNPKAPGCGSTLPPYDTCEKSPATFGCAPVIAEREAIAQCIASPKAPGCGSTLPPYDTCAVSPNTYGCAPVIAERNAVTACMATPKAPGCAATLPTWETCSAAPGTYGCGPVIAERDAITACIATPKGPNCAITLPSYETCTVSPATYGCAPVIAERAAITACMATPSAPSCREVLPPLDSCQATPGAYGCSAVLERAAFLACVANPTAAGCGNRLPAQSLCNASPGLEGCAQRRQLTFDACLVNKADPICAGILPTLAQCEANQAMAGCAVVLPTMQQCILGPTQQGCSVVLPKLEQCAVNPNLQGCEAVLPKPDFCGTHPLDPRCAVFNPAPTQGGGEAKKPVAEVLQNTVNLINTRTPAQEKLPAPTPTVGTPDGGTTSSSGTANGGGEGGTGGSTKPSEQSDKQSGPAAGSNTGAKNEKPATKMYCN